jgi:hypothetical protein
MIRKPRCQARTLAGRGCGNRSTGRTDGHWACRTHHHEDKRAGWNCTSPDHKGRP